MMKKLTTSLLTIFALCGEVAAQQVAVPNVEALKGRDASLTLQLDVNGGSYTALEFDIQFPEEGFTTGSGHTAAGWDGTFTIGDVGGVSIDNLARCGVMSYSDTPIPDEDLRTLGTVDFTVPAGIALGNYTVTLKNMTLVGETRVPVADVTFTLSVVESIVLDELATAAPTAVNGVNVKVKRAIKANSWSTICLPFAMTAEQVTSAFGAGVMVKDFTGCETTESGSDITALKLNFSTVSAMEANHPYLIKVANAITYEDGFTVEGVNIDPEAEPSVNRDEKSTKVSSKITIYSYNKFVGTYVKDTQVPNLCLFISNDKFYYSNGSTMMKAFRGYFDFYDVLSSVDTSSARISMSFDDETTGINMVHGSGIKADSYYDLQGRKIENPKKGLYINNGKKVVVK